MIMLFESLPPWRKMQTSALYVPGLDCATAAFMKRSWLIAEVMARVPTPAHAARRMKSRRETLERLVLLIDYFWIM
jgi:hypothetical protein